MADVKCNNGGPAFPSDATENEYASVGMSLRDYFAAKALPKAIEHCSVIRMGEMNEMPWGRPAAKLAYAIADAMLAERDK